VKHYPHCKYPGVIQEINAAYALLNYCLYAEANQCLKLANEMSQEERGLKLKFEFKFVQAIPTRASDWPKISEQNFVGLWSSCSEMETSNALPEHPATNNFCQPSGHDNPRALTQGLSKPWLLGV